MNLIEKISRVEKQGNKAIVDFDNNLSVGYERKNDGEIVYGIIGREGLPYETRKPRIVSSNQVSEFSRKTMQVFFQYGNELDKKLEEAEISIVEKMLEPLEIQEIKRPDLKGIAEGLGIGVLSPVLFPLGCVGFFSSMLFSKIDVKELQTYALYGIYSPAMPFGAFREMANPSRQYLKITNDKFLVNKNSMESSDEKYAAINLKGQKRKFNWIDVTLPSGDSWFSSYGPYYSNGLNIRRRGGRKLPHTTADYYLKTDASTMEELVSLVAERSSIPKKAQEFSRLLTSEKQQELLEYIGLI